jgi:hypothetical protein
VFTANDADEANEVVAKLTTKGDLLVTSGSALNRLGVGANGAIFVADSTATNGVNWLGAGDAGFVLTSAGAGNALTWAEAASPIDVLQIQVFS